MPRSRLDELLATNASGGLSRTNMLGELAAVSGSGGVGGVRSGVSTGPQDVLSGLIQPNSGVGEQLSSLTTQISNLTSVQQTQVAATQDNTQAVTQNSSEKGTGGSSVGSTVGSIASSLLGGGLSLSPIITGLIGLIGGGSSDATPAVLPFQLPSPVQYESGLTGGSSSTAEPVSYGAGGQPRAQSSGSAPQVTIQVNAMDSQSFMDHSDEIASAVREAILNSHSLNDVISEL